MDRYLTGNLSEEEFEHLSDALKADPKLRERFVVHSHIDSALRTEAAEQDQTTEFPKSFLRTKLLWCAGGIAATIAIYSGITSLTSPPPTGAKTTSPHLAKAEKRSGKVGVVALALDADHSSGSTLYQGEFRANKGLFELNLNSGVVILARAPLHLDLRDSTEIFCHKGSLRLRVPAQAKGFRILTKEHKIVDHGTEFGVEVDGTSSSLEVFEGEVEFFRTQQESRRMFQGDQEHWGSHPKNKANYPNIDQLKNKSEDLIVRQLHRWNETLAGLKSDPSLRLLYDFKTSDPWGKTIANIAPDAPPETDGALIGCNVVEGRWPGTYAIDFKHGTDAIRIHEPRDYQSISLAAWVLLDESSSPYSSLLTTEDWKSGGIDWEFVNGHKLVFHPRPGPYFDCDDNSLPSSSFGEWTFLAFTYDYHSGVGRHYLNGTMIHESSSRHKPTLKISHAQIGNWNTLEKREFRNLNGRIDFMAVWDREISSAGILELFEAGRVDQ